MLNQSLRPFVCVAISVILAALPSITCGQSADTEEPTLRENQQSEWAFPPKSWVLIKSTTQVDGEAKEPSFRKVTMTEKGLEMSYVGGSLNGEKILKQPGRHYMPKRTGRFAETEIKSGDKMIKCVVIEHEDSGPPQNPLNELLKGQNDEETKVSRRVFSLYMNEGLDFPYRGLPIAGPDLALLFPCLGAKVECFAEGFDEPISTQSLFVKEEGIEKAVAGKTITCVREVGDGEFRAAGKKVSVNVERLLSESVLGHVVFERKTTTSDGVIRIDTEEIVDFHSSRKE